MEIKDIKELIKALDESSVGKLEFVKNDQVLILEKEKTEQIVYASKSETTAKSYVDVVADGNVTKTDDVVATVEEEKEVGTKTEVRAPLVGVFYASSSPEADPFVAVGDKVAAGDTICILEAMKVLNEIKAPVSGIVKEIFVQNGDVVEFDQVLLEIE